MSEIQFNPCNNKHCKYFQVWLMNGGAVAYAQNWARCLCCKYFQRNDWFERGDNA